jgi:hypothetical protein
VGQFAVAALYERRSLLKQKSAVIDHRYKKTKVTHYRRRGHGPAGYRGHLGEVDFSCGLVKAVIPAKAGIEWEIRPIEPSNSTPDGFVQSGSAIVAAWIPPAMAGREWLRCK